jgi:uncharacterized membrane protein YdjX (TVP38/TMEM64 family)
VTPARKRWLRLGIFLAVVATVIVVGEVTGLRKRVTIARIRELTLHFHALGIVVYTIAFCIGEVIHVPGLLFCAAAIAIWGRLEGGVIAWGASVLSISTSFVVVRAVGGHALADIKHRWMQKILAQLEANPIRTVALLRAVLVISPPVTYALALSRVRFRDMFIGSAIGLMAPMVLVAIFLDYVLRWMGAL